MTPAEPTHSSGDQSPPPVPRARTTKQKRAVDRQKRIAEAAIGVIARHGLAGVTHRLVARDAGVSLSATTYHYETKSDIIADASAQLLNAYTDSFRRFLSRHQEPPSLTFHGFAMRVVANAAGRNRAAVLAWCEIILDAARHSETQALASHWFEKLHEIWLEIATAMSVDDAPTAVRSTVDMVIGLIFVVLPLGLNTEQVEAVLCGGADPASWAPPGAEDGITTTPLRGGRKADETRTRILEAAIAILIEEGPGAISYRAVATRAGLTAPAPVYYYPSVDALLNAAQIRLFEAAKDRYRLIMASVDYSALDIHRLTDLTTAVFQREATEFGAVSIASYPIRLEAARHAQLRSTMWAAIRDQNEAWRRLLGQLSPAAGPLEPLLVQSLFTGKLIRILATGARITDLADVRSSFATILCAVSATRPGAGPKWYDG